MSCPAQNTGMHSTRGVLLHPSTNTASSEISVSFCTFTASLAWKPQIPHFSQVCWEAGSLMQALDLCLEWWQLSEVSLDEKRFSSVLSDGTNTHLGKRRKSKPKSQKPIPKLFESPWEMHITWGRVLLATQWPSQETGRVLEDNSMVLQTWLRAGVSHIHI